MLQAKYLTYKDFIKEISLDFSPGILYGILGPNGSGKTTLLKTLSGIWKPTSGEVLWNGQELLIKNRWEISQTISLVPQNPQVQFDFPVHDFVLMGRYSHQGREKKEKTEIILEEALKNVDVWHLRHQLITQLSSGERQRVYIARALVTESPVLLLDEPTASLDIRHQLEIWHLLKKLVIQGKIVIVTIHDLPATARFCDEVVVLDHGKKIAAGDFANVMHPRLLREVFGVIENVQPIHLCFDLPQN